METRSHHCGSTPHTRLARALITLLVVFAMASRGAAQSRKTTLDIYVVDVEGGDATLFVSSSGASLLVDSGNGGPQGAGPANAVSLPSVGRSAHFSSPIACTPTGQGPGEAVSPRAAVRAPFCAGGGRTVQESGAALKIGRDRGSEVRVSIDDLENQRYGAPTLFPYGCLRRA
jgi:hypothetical protein